MTERLINRHANAARTLLHPRHGRTDLAMRYAKALGHLQRVAELTGLGIGETIDARVADPRVRTKLKLRIKPR